MPLSSGLTLAAFVLAALVYFVWPDGARDLGHVAFCAFTTLILIGATAGNLRLVALTPTVTLLVPEDRHDRANGIIGTAGGIAFAITSVFSSLAVGLLGMAWCVGIATVLTALVLVHLVAIRIDEPARTPLRARRPPIGNRTELEGGTNRSGA